MILKPHMTLHDVNYKKDTAHNLLVTTKQFPSKRMLSQAKVTGHALTLVKLLRSTEGKENKCVQTTVSKMYGISTTTTTKEITKEVPTTEETTENNCEQTPYRNFAYRKRRLLPLQPNTALAQTAWGK